MSAQDAAGKTTTLTFTEPQLALLRQIVYHDLMEAADNLHGQAEEAAQGLSDVVGEDAEGTYQSVMRYTIELLDIIGWSTRGDGELLVAHQKNGRDA